MLHPQKPPRRSDESLVTPWIFFRWLLVGAYVGAATVGIFAAWFVHDIVSESTVKTQLTTSNGVLDAKLSWCTTPKKELLGRDRRVTFN